MPTPGSRSTFPSTDGSPSIPRLPALLRRLRRGQGSCSIPTPRASSGASGSSTTTSPTRRYLTEVAATSGRQHIEQLRVWFRAKYETLLRWARDTHRHATRSSLQFSTVGITLVFVVLLLINLRHIYQAVLVRRLAANPARSPSQAASIWYERMTRRLSRRGFPRKPSHTPKEFATSIEDAEVREAVERFNGHYERARFGESAEDATRLPEIYKEVVDRS